MENLDQYPLGFFKKRKLVRNICVNCSCTFWWTRKNSLCGDNDCRKPEDKIKLKSQLSPIDSDQVIHHYMDYFSNGRIPLRRASSVIRRGYHQFCCAGVCAFRNLVHNPNLAPVGRNKYVNAQFCFRFYDHEYVGETKRHSSGFVMLGLHQFESKNNRFVTTWKEDVLQELTEFFTVHLGLNPADIFYHASYWTDNHLCAGPSIQLFINGIEICNLVMVTREYEGEQLSFVDMGMGLERLENLLGHRSPYTIDRLKSNLRLIAIATKDRAYPGKSGLGFNIRKVLEEIMHQNHPREKLERELNIILDELSGMFSEDYRSVGPRIMLLYDEEQKRLN